jgi:hypothetical protein
MSRQFITDKHYKRFIAENITITNDKRRVSFKLITQDFCKWLKENNIPEETEIYSVQGNYNTTFLKELRTKIEELICIKSVGKMSICDVKRNVILPGGRGWEGIELKNTKLRSRYFSAKDYELFVSSKIEITKNEENKLVVRFLMQEFISWCYKNNINFLRGEEFRCKDKFALTFYAEFTKQIETITGKKYFPNRSYKGIKGVFWFLKIN